MSSHEVTTKSSGISTAYSGAEIKTRGCSRGLCREGVEPTQPVSDGNRDRDHPGGEEPPEERHARTEEREAEQDADPEGLPVAALFADVSLRDGLSIAGRSDEQGRRVAVQIPEAGPGEDRGEHVSRAEEHEEELIQSEGVH